MFAARLHGSMRQARGSLVIMIASALVGYAANQPTAFGQKQLADDLIVLSAGQRAKETQRDSALGGPGPGSQFNRLGSLAGSGGSTLRALPGSESRSFVQRKDVLSAAANPVPSNQLAPPEVLTTPPRINPADLPAGGPLERPQSDEEGPPEGLTLDTAIAMVADQNLSLRAKFQEIPKATADVLTAGLRGNPLVFASADEVPYGRYSGVRPGEVGYGVTIIQPVDINRKRVYRVIVAERAREVVQAQYQDAVRLEIENLHSRFVDVLAAREVVRYVEASLVGLREVRSTVEQLVKGQEISTLEVDRVAVQVDAAELAYEEAVAALDRAKQNLAAMLMVPAPDVIPLDIRGSIRTDDAGLPDVDQLLELANANRPDLRAYQLGVRRAAADVDLAVKERYPDIFVLYTPWGVKDNTATGGQNLPAWGLSAMATVPIFNRNQGNIRRAELTVSQTKLEWQHLTRQVEAEVRQAFREYQMTSDKVKRLDATILPRAKTIRDKTLVQLRGGQVDTLAYLQSQRDYVEVVRQYRDALIALRRAALHINTVVGIRLVY